MELLEVNSEPDVVKTLSVSDLVPDVLPISGRLPYELCQRYVEAIALVSDVEIKVAVSTLYRSGLLVEPSGAAAFAAIVNNKIPKLEGKNVVCILSGGNIAKDELHLRAMVRFQSISIY
uniref:L-serine deaminase n=1 Tax=Echeneis naucrates TaxID=173247 RepID=A0A665WYJ4_ECHNA